MASLSISGLTKRYDGHAAVRGVTLEIADGELFVLVGPSGSGKSTLLRMIAGLEGADGGSIAIGDRVVTDVPPNKRNVGMVFQSYALFPHLTVAGNIAFGLLARGGERTSVEERVRAAATTLGIGDLVERFPRQLSGGERQRVALARALVREPDVLLMDEPLSNLDAQLRAQARGEILRLQRSVGTTTVYVTHDQIEALSLGHRIGVLREGAVEQVGTPQDIYDHPATLFTARFIGSPPMNIVRMTGSRGVCRAGPVRVRVARAPADVLVGARPEHVHVAGSRWSEHREPRLAFPATVETMEPVGDQVFLSVVSDGHRLTARVEPSFRPEEGSRLKVWLDEDRIHLFDPATEKAVPR